VQCSIDGCERPVKAKGWCYAHYMRDYRYGSPTAPKRRQFVDIAGQRFGRLVAIEHEPAPSRFWVLVCDCGATRRAAYEALSKGLATSCGARDCRRKDVVGYSAVHERLRTRRGPARAHRCVDCGGPAAQWSLNHDGASLRASEGPYSMDESRYVPRCVPCHKRYDLAR
jgi:hypothetical protein